MKYRSHNAATDANQPEIVKALRDRGALVVILGTPVDLLVGYREAWVLAEVKSSRRAKVQQSQKDFLEQAQKHHVPMVFLHDQHDVDYWFPDTSRSPSDVILSTPGKDTDATSGTSNTKHGR